MVDRVEGFLEVEKDASCNFFIVKSLSYLFSNTYESMISRMLFPKPKLFFIKKVINFKVFVDPFKNYFFKDFVYIRQ